ncbi:hypothetical protein C0416_03655 [bacterium]|nr:hypothetical protein [bacterium]
MKYLFGEDRFVYEKSTEGLPKVVSLSIEPSKKEVPVAEKRDAIIAASKEARKEARKAINPFEGVSKEKVATAFDFAKKEKFDEERVGKMLAISDKMAVYDLWRGGVSRLKNEKEKDLKDNQGFDRMAAQFAKNKVDEQGRAYFEINLYGKDKFEMNIGAGHICPPSWLKVAIVDTNGNTKIGERKVPGKDNVDGHKIGYYDEKGEYINVFSLYKVYPLSVLSEEEISEKKIIAGQVEKENAYYVENKEKLEKYALGNESSYSMAQMEMSSPELQKIRESIPGLEDVKDPGERVAAVAKWITEKGNNIYAKHCGNWVDRVYAIAGVKGRKDLYRNLDYAKVNGKLVGKNAEDPQMAKKLIDAREGKHAIKERLDLVDGLQTGTWLWINNRNSGDIAGNHSVVFIGWENKQERIALCANWLNPKNQKISKINFNKVPIVSITRPTEVEDKFERLSPEEIARYEERQLAFKQRPANFEAKHMSGLKLQGKNYALEVQEKYGVPWQVTYAMFILESGAGTSNLARNENAFFGIKAHPEDRNATREYGGAKYRKYGSMEASFADYGRTVTNGRYKEAVKYKNNPMMYLAVILGAGYCPNENYFSKIVQIWKREGIRDIGFISQGDLEKSLNNVAHRERSVDTYVQELIQPDKLQAKFYGVASRNGLLES